MQRRELSKLLLASAATTAAVTETAKAQSCTLPCYPQTAKEVTAQVIPVNTAYLPGDVRRYGADPTGKVSSVQAINNAAACGGEIFFGGSGATYLIDAPIVFFGNGFVLQGLGRDVTTLQLATATQSNGIVTTGTIIFGDQNRAAQTHNYELRDMTVNTYERNTVTKAVQCLLAGWTHIENVLFFQINGSAIYAEQSWDCRVTLCHFDYCGSANNPVISLNYIAGSAAENNHWSVSDCQLEASYWIDIQMVGVSDEADHFINRCKFGVPSYVIQSAPDTAQYHIYGLNLVGTSIVDNWFFSGGMAYMSNCNSYKIQANHGRFLSQGVWDDGGGGSSYLISGNHIYGNNSSNTTTGSLSTNHWGIRVGGYNGAVGPGNDVALFSVNYLVWTSAINNFVLLPQSGSVAASVAGGEIVDGGTTTRIQTIG